MTKTVEKQEMTLEQANANLTKLLEKDNLETFFDAAEMCAKLKVFASSALVLAEEDEDNYDDVTRKNLMYLSQLMEKATSMFFRCDPYYR